jgi:hypothetical protein
MRLDEQPGPWLLLTQLVPASSFSRSILPMLLGHVQHLSIKQGTDAFALVTGIKGACVCTLCGLGSP